MSVNGGAAALLRHTASTTSRNHVLELVRRADYEGYLTSLFMPTRRTRDTAVALRALNVETAFVKGAVTKTELGLMRLAWWQQRVDAAFKPANNAPPSHPVDDALADAIAHSSFTKGWFSRLIDERMRQLDDTQPATLADVERTAENVHSSLLYLMLESVDVKHVDADHIASHIGVAAGIVTLLRALPVTLTHSDVQLPQDVMAKHGLSKEHLVRSIAASASVEHQASDPADAAQVRRQLADCVFDVAVVAKSHIDQARTLLETSQAPEVAKCVFVNAVPTLLYLERLERANFDCFSNELHQRSFALYWRLWQNGFRRRPW
jgi:NADH dehydrogenase [ubiquinone] 1 alpha subcomplex assembly factor 6